MTRLSKIIYLSTTVAVLALLYFFVPVSLLPRCPFNYLTGLFCPGCGSQRAFAAILHGQFLAAFKLNMLFVASAPFIIYSAFIAVFNIFSSRQLQQQLFYTRWFAILLLVVILAFWVARNVPFYPFNLLAPHK